MKKALIITVCIVCAVMLTNQFKEDIWDLNAKSLRGKVLSIEENDKRVNLAKITPFEWDVVYSFDPYTPKEKIYDTVGYKWDNIKETVSEGMNQIVFMKDGKVVCYLYGYPSNNGYSIVFSGDDFKNTATMLKIKDNLNFKVERKDNVIYLTND